MKMNDLTGLKFGMLTVICQIPERKCNRIHYKVKCDCGTEKSTSGCSLVSGKSVSCGCKRKMAAVTHGMSNSREYAIWHDMHRRCSDKKNKSFPFYGGRGITVCDRWNKFENFILDLGFANGQTLERSNNDIGYCPENCLWASRLEQSRNRRSSHIIEFEGESLCISAWAERVGLKRDTLKRRIYLGWTIHRALTEGVRT